ncbi:MAG TPA: hypothetical protein VGB48_03290 [Allosphingosinicella sp.]
MALAPRLLAALCAALLLGGCDPQPEVPTRAAGLGKLPAELCKKAADGLVALADTAVFEHDGQGSATLGETVWLGMSKDAREQLARTLALDAACKQNDAPRTIQVLIKAETGRTLTNPVIELAPGADMMFEDS